MPQPRQEHLRTYGGATADERQARRRAELMEAAFDLLGTEGWERTTVRAVCSRAGLNDRYFYESFADRNALLLAVYDATVAQGVQAIADTIQDTPSDVRTRTRAAIKAGLAFLVDDPRRGRVALIEAQASEVLRERARLTTQLLTTMVAEQAHELLPVVASDTDIELGARSVVGGGLELVSTWLRGELPITLEHLADFLIAMLLNTANIYEVLQQEVES